jgi:MFS family permease
LGHFSVNYGYYFVISWLPSYLVKVGGYTVSQMAWISATIFAVNASATLLSGIAADQLIKRGSSVTRVRKSFLLAAIFGTVASIAASALAPPHVTVWLLGIAAAFFGLYTSNGFAVIGTLAGPRAAGRWAGAQNLAGQLAGVVAPIMTGIIVDRTQSYFLAFATSAAVMAVAALSWTVIIQRIAEVEWPRCDD